MEVPLRSLGLWVPEDKAPAKVEETQRKERTGRNVIAYFKLLALGGVLLDGVFHWMESGSWLGTFDFILDDFWEVENENLAGPGYLQGMQAVSITAHLAFLLGLALLLLTPVKLERGSWTSGIKQISNLPLQGRGRWLCYGVLTALAAFGILVLVLSLKGSGLLGGGGY